jgi:hypothetical protein
MTALNEDLTSLNFQFLMLARECARNQPMDAIWKFNLNAEGIEKLSAMSIDELREAAACSRAVVTLIPVTTTSSDISSSILAALIPTNVHL